MRLNLQSFILAFACFYSLAVTAQKKKVAVVTFYVDKYIGQGALSGGSIVTSIGQLADDPQFSLKPPLEHFHKVFFNEFSKQFPFELVDEQQVIGNPAYKAFETKWGESKDVGKSGLMQRYQVIDGYKPFMETLGKNRTELAMLEMFPDVDGVMFVYMDYEFLVKAAVAGMGTAGIKSNVRMKLWNREGKKVFAINEGGTSKSSVALVAGIPLLKPASIQPLCVEASDKVIADLQKRLAKIAAKSAKKL